LDNFNEIKRQKIDNFSLKKLKNAFWSLFPRNAFKDTAFSNIYTSRKLKGFSPKNFIFIELL